MSRSLPSVKVQRDQKNDILVTLGLDTRAGQPPQKTTESGEDLVVCCDPYRSQGKLSVRFKDACTTPPPSLSPKVQARSSVKRKLEIPAPSSSWSVEDPDETLLNDDSDVETDWFEGDDEKSKAGRKLVYMRQDIPIQMSTSDFERVPVFFGFHRSTPIFMTRMEG